MLITSYTPRPELLDLPGAPETVSQHSTQELFFTNRFVKMNEESVQRRSMYTVDCTNISFDSMHSRILTYA